MRVPDSFCAISAMLPDDYALVFGAEHLVAFLDVECREERLDIAEGSVHAPAAKRMGVGLGAGKNFFLADVSGPYVGVREIESLVGSEAFNSLTLAVAKGIMVCSIGNAKTALVGDVLTEGEMTVCVGVAGHDDLIELCGQFFGKFIECCCVFFCPPVGEVSVLVELTALVVKSVSHFMADHNTDSTVVLCIVGFGIEVGGLKDSGGEAYFVCGGIVVGVYGLG